MDITILFRNYIQIISFVLSIYIFVMIHIWSKRNVKRTLWSIPIIIWILHTIVFIYVYLLILYIHYQYHSQFGAQLYDYMVIYQ